LWKAWAGVDPGVSGADPYTRGAHEGTLTRDVHPWKEERMLVLSRKTRDAIVIGHEVRVMVLSIGRDQVRLGIQAPPDIEVHREEVYLAIQEANRQAAASSAEATEGLAAVLPGRAAPTGAPSAGDADADVD
jgi:carbon storage regulator